MKVLLLGAGRQGRAALHDLARSGDVSEVIVGDVDLDALEGHVAACGYGERVRCAGVDAADAESVDRLLAQGVDLIVDLLPVTFHGTVARAAVRRGIHLVHASYASDELKALDAEARAQGVTILPECGMDPGIDLVLLGEAVRSLDRVDEIVSYGAGFPEPRAADNPLRYKVTWRFEGVLASYLRPGRVIRDAKIVEIAETKIFAPENIHHVEIDGVGRLEAFPNGDALAYGGLLGIETGSLQRLERCVLRWPGHCAVWKSLVDLHLLDSEPVTVDGAAVDRKRFLAAVMEPHLQYGDGERDVVVVRVEARGYKEGKRSRALFQVVDRRDLATGFSAMSRTVGYAASIGALLIGRGRIARRGVLSPVRDIPFGLFAEELAKRGICLTSELAFTDLPGRSGKCSDG